MADLVKRPPGRALSKRARLRDRGLLTEYLAFCLAGDVYATPVAFIREILKPPPLTPVPRAPAAVLGIVSVRGQLVTVYDLRRKLRVAESPTSRRGRILLVESGEGETLGLYVDEVLQVYRLAEAEIEPAALALGGEVASYISGIARPSAAAVRAPFPLESSALGADAASVLSLSPSGRDAPDASVVILLDIRALLQD